MPDGSLWHRISIVTPSYNQGQFIEETIRSVLLQGYPNLEYVVIDGGSADNSVEVVERYEPWLTYWVSEPDRGQSHAINKGFKRVTGQIMAWINSDDFYCPESFQKVSEFLTKGSFEWVAGKYLAIGVDGVTVERGIRPPTTLPPWLISNRVGQPAVFWKASLWRLESQLDEDLHYCLDYDLWLRFLSHGCGPGWIDRSLANFRYHTQSKTVKDNAKWDKEGRAIMARIYPGLSMNERIMYHLLCKQKMVGEWLEMEDATNYPFIRVLQTLRNSRFYAAFRKAVFD